MVAPILDHMTALSDPTRCRMLMLLEKQELTVSELCAVLQMPQSTVSRHLKTLSDDDWVTSRRDGTSRFYTMPVDDLDAAAKRLWPIIREQVASTTGAGQDDRRLRGVLTRRRAKSQEFFATAAGGWDHLRGELFGDEFFLWAVLGLIDPSLIVGDLGAIGGFYRYTRWDHLRRTLPAACVGVVLGTLLMGRLSDTAFAPVLGWIILTLVALLAHHGFGCVTLNTFEDGIRLRAGETGPNILSGFFSRAP